eukprot:16436126-Heterocapsa_arctica.AAC.1
MFWETGQPIPALFLQHARSGCLTHLRAPAKRQHGAGAIGLAGSQPAAGGSAPPGKDVKAGRTTRFPSSTGECLRANARSGPKPRPVPWQDD